MEWNDNFTWTEDSTTLEEQDEKEGTVKNGE